MLRAEGRQLEGPAWSPAAQVRWGSDFYFVQAADTQLGLMYNFGKNGTDGTPYPDSQWDEEIELCKKSVEILNKLQPKPAFFIVCGDLVDAFASEYPEIRARQEADLKQVYRGLDPSVPMICVCGNHDVGNVPTPASIERYKDSFGDDYFSFYKHGCAFLVLQSQFYEDASLVQEQYREHEAWLEEQLKLAKERKVTHIVIFQHIPWFLKDWAEGKDYFNIEKELRLRKLEQFHQAGVKKIFCGHYHRNAGGIYKELEVVVTSAIGCQIADSSSGEKDEHGMRVVTVRKAGIEHKYHPLAAFPARVIL